MRNLTVRPARAAGRRRDDRGAVAVLVAILIGTGVLFGMGALVIDVGRIYQNRAELQNGADAAALAIAKSCAAGTCTPLIATRYADLNASSLTGGTAAVDMVCGYSSTGAVVGKGTCTPSGTDCPADPPFGTDYVDVQTSTELPNGSTVLPPVFSRALAGSGSDKNGVTVAACAQAEWGAPLIATTAGITLSLCDWSEATSNGTSYANAPPYPPNPTGLLPVVIDLHDAKGQEDDSSCPSGPAGQTAPGNFGWTASNSLCQLTPSSFTYHPATGTYTYGGNTGNSTPTGCQTSLTNAQYNQTLLYIPVYSAYNLPGSNATYTLQGLAAFALTGYNFGKQFQIADRITKQLPCGGNGKDVTCISGYFTQQLIPPSSIGVSSLGGQNLGLNVIPKLTG